MVPAVNLVFARQYVFDHRNGSQLQRWLIDEFIGGVDGLGSAAIDGFFFDDNWSSRGGRGGHGGASEMDPYNAEDMGLTPADEVAMQKGECCCPLAAPAATSAPC